MSKEDQIGRRELLRRFVGLDELSPQGELPRLTSRERRALHILTSPAAKLVYGSTLALGLLTKEQATPPPEITIAHGDYRIYPSHPIPLRFHSSPTALAGDREADNVIPRDVIILDGIKKSSLASVKSFRITSPELVQGNDQFLVDGRLVKASPYWMRIPNVSVQDGEKIHQQDLFVSMSTLTTDDITQESGAGLVVAKKWATGYFVNNKLIAYPNSLGKISDITYLE